MPYSQSPLSFGYPRLEPVGQLAFELAVGGIQWDETAVAQPVLGYRTFG